MVAFDQARHDTMEIDLGGVTVHVRHVGGDHSADSSVMYVEPDTPARAK